MTVRAGFEYPDPPIDGGFTGRHKHQGTIGPQGLADIPLDLTNPNRVRINKRGAPEPRPGSAPAARPALRAEPGALDQLIHALAQLHDQER